MQADTCRSKWMQSYICLSVCLPLSTSINSLETLCVSSFVASFGLCIYLCTDG